jgi:hypothetical protein
VGAKPDNREDRGIEKSYTKRMEEECDDHGENKHGGDIVERTVVDGMALEKYRETYPVKKGITDLVQIRKIGAKDDYPGSIPAGIMEREHPGDNRNSEGIYEMLGQHTRKILPRSLNGFLSCKEFLSGTPRISTVLSY